MKNIDADKLIERLEEMKRAEYENCGGVNSKTGALQEVQELIDSLQQEQPEVQNGKFVFPKYLYARTKDNKTIDMSYAPQDMTAVEYIRNDFVHQEQQEVDLEKASRNVYESLMGGTMDDVRRDMVELGKVLNARKEK